MESRKSCLGHAEITSFEFLVLFKDKGCKESPRFNLFVSDVNQGNREREARFKIFLCGIHNCRLT